MAVKRPTGDDEPSLFQELDATTEDCVSTGASQEPRWEFFAEPFTDYIAEYEPVVAYSYSLNVLGATSSFYTRPVLRELLSALSILSRSPKKGLRNQVFTVYGGDVLENDAFVLGVGTQSAEVVDFLSSGLRRVPGHMFVESATSDRLIPLFRYDNGYVAQYREEGEEGSTYVDTVDFNGSGQTIYLRIWRPVEYIERKRSVYGKLVKPSVTGPAKGSV